MNWPEPTSTSMSWAASILGAPSTARLNATVATSPALGERSSAGAWRVACSRRRRWTSASIIASVAAVDGRFTAKPCHLTSAISGRTSNRALYENASAGFSSSLANEGCESGCTCLALRAWLKVSSTRRWATSAWTRPP